MASYVISSLTFLEPEDDRANAPTHFLTYLQIKGLSFSEMIARLLTIVGPKKLWSCLDPIQGGPNNASCNHKSSFEIKGVFYTDVDNKKKTPFIFAIYDYKQDQEIHLAGTNETATIMTELKQRLERLIAFTNPTPFVRFHTYDDEVRCYSFPPITLNWYMITPPTCNQIPNQKNVLNNLFGSCKKRKK